VQAKRKKPFSSVQFALSAVLIAILFIATLSAITREAVGEPVVPPQIDQFFHRQPPSLPQGFTYDFQVLDPVKQAPIAILPLEGSVELRLAVTNASPLPATLEFPTSLQCEFISRRVDSFLGGLFVVPIEVWRSSYFYNVSHTPTQLNFKPGETKVFAAVWTFQQTGDQSAPPGDYRILARFYGATFPIRIDKPI